MAAVTLTFTLTDGAGKTAQHEVNLPAGTLIADAQDHAEFAADLIDDLSGCAITGCTISYPVPWDTDASVKTTPVATSDVEEGARFNWRTAGNYPTSGRIPGFLESLIVSGGTEVDQSATEVINYISYMLNGNVAVVGDPTDYRGDDIVRLVNARESFTKSRKRR